MMFDPRASATRLSARQARDDDVEDVDEAIDDFLEDVADAVHDGHKASPYGLEDSFDTRDNCAHFDCRRCLD